eukprot:139158-Prorocentrum_minimum.AAC.4
MCRCRGLRRPGCCAALRCRRSATPVGIGWQPSMGVHLSWNPGLNRIGDGNRSRLIRWNRCGNRHLHRRIYSRPLRHRECKDGKLWTVRVEFVRSTSPEHWKSVVGGAHRQVDAWPHAAS